MASTVRAKAIALNPNTATHTAAVLQMDASRNITIFDTRNGNVLQTFYFNYHNEYETDGSATGISYTSDSIRILTKLDFPDPGSPERAIEAYFSITLFFFIIFKDYCDKNKNNKGQAREIKI